MPRRNRDEPIKQKSFRTKTMVKMAARSPSARSQAPGMVADLAEFFRSLAGLTDPYRPELHYMRGPGPKWHAKHGPAPAAIDAMPDFAGLHVRG
jgi:hypothetical protein